MITLWELMLYGIIAVETWLLVRSWRSLRLCNHCHDPAIGRFETNGIQYFYCPAHEELYVDTEGRRFRRQIPS